MPISSISGVRGIPGTDLTPELLSGIGGQFGSFIKGGRCLLARDTRPTGDWVSSVVAAGLMAAGCGVLDLGVAPTPVVFREVAKRGVEGGLIVTASHNSPEWNGVKMVVKGGRGAFEEELVALKASTEHPFGDAYGNHVRETFFSYAEDLVSYVGRGACEGLRVALDLGGGAGCSMVPRIFKALGCRVTVVNGTPGIFARVIDPVEDALTELRHTVVREGCDAGFAYDCDADRVVVVNGDGAKLPPDHTLLLCLKHLWEDAGARSAVVSVDTSMAVEKLAASMHRALHYSRVGEANVVQGMLREGCSIGGEGSSGGVIVGGFNLCRDGILAAALITKMVKKGGALKDLLRGIPRLCQVRRKIPCPRAVAASVVEALAKGERVDRTDGIKIRPSPSSWILVRPSNTEDVLRISAEAPSREGVENLIQTYLAKIRRIVREAS